MGYVVWNSRISLPANRRIYRTWKAAFKAATKLNQGAADGTYRTDFYVKAL